MHSLYSFLGCGNVAEFVNCEIVNKKGSRRDKASCAVPKDSLFCNLLQLLSLSIIQLSVSQGLIYCHLPARGSHQR